MSYLGRQLNVPASTVQLTAEGAITAGKPCIVEADGDVAQIVQTSVSQGVGSPVVFTSTAAYSNEHASVFDSSNNKVVFCYSDYGNSGYGTAVVGTVSGTTISFGTPVVFESASTGTEVSAAFDSSNNKVVIAYQDSGNSSYGTAIVGTVSGDSISFGSAAVFESAISAGIGICFDSLNNKTVIVYKDQGNSNYGTAVVATVSGTSISFGTPVVYRSARAEYNVATFDTTNNKVVVAYQYRSTNAGEAVVGTVSGTSISFGSTVTFESSSIKEYLSITFDSNAGKVFISYQQSNDHRGIVGTVSGTSISFGSAADINSGESRDSSCTFDSAVNKVVVIYDDENNSNYGTAVPVTISGTGFSVGTETVFESANVASLSCCFDSNEKVVAIQYSDTGNSNYGTGVIYQNAGTHTTLTAENFIGFAENDCTDNGLATIQLGGSVNDKQTGLTAGQTYFVQTDGTIGTTADSPSVTAGTAVSSTEILVKG
tara:strand:+ start:125 stop:1582 length:1458 start_codon:yes stop_codon:yes gene_type:complete